MNELQAGIEPALAVLPQPPVLLQPRKAALHHPALGHDLEGVQLAPLGHLHRHLLTQNLAHSLCKGLSCVAAVGQYAADCVEVALAALEGLQGPCAIRHFGGGHRHSMRKALCIDRNVALDARDLLARVIALEARRIRVLDALRVHDQERRACVAPQFLAGHANLIFLKPAPARSHRAGPVDSICSSTHRR